MASFWTNASLRALAAFFGSCLLLCSCVCGCSTPSSSTRHLASVGRTRAALSASALSNEFALQNVVSTTAVPGTVTQHIAVAGQNALVVWANTTGTGITAVYSIRTDLIGAPIDATATLVARSTDPSQGVTAIAVGTDGTDFLLVYVKQGGAYALRVRGSDGTFLDPIAQPIALTAGVSFSTGGVAIGWSSGRWLVAWGSTNVVAGNWIVDGVAQEAGVTGALLPNFGGSGADAPTVAVGDGIFLVAIGHVAMRYRATDGALLDPEPIAFANRSAGTFPQAVFDGTNFFLAWSGSLGTAPIHGARIRAADGVLLDPDDDENDVSGSLLLLDDGHTRMTPQVSVVDGAVAVSYLDVTFTSLYSQIAASLRAFAFDPAAGQRIGGSPSDPGTVLAANVLAAPMDIEFNAAGAGLGVSVSNSTFSETVQPIGHVKGLLSLPPSPPTPVSKIGRTTGAVQVAANASGWLATWIDSDPGGATLRANRVRAADHAILDATPIAITDTAWTAAANWGVASNGSDYLVVWLSGQSIFGRSIAADGTVGATFSIGSVSTAVPGYNVGAESVAVGSDGTRYLVAWSETTTSSIRARRLTAALTPIDAADLIVAPYAPESLSVAAVNTANPAAATFIVSPSPGQGPAISFARVGSMQGSTPDRDASSALAAAVVTYNPSSVWASNGNDALVVWSDGPSYVDPQSYFGATLGLTPSPIPFDHTVNVTGSGPVSLAAAPSLNVGVTPTALSWDGKAYVFASFDGPDTTGVRALRVARIAPTPALLDPPGNAPGMVVTSAVTAAGLEPGSVALSPGPAGQTLVAYVAWDDASLGQVLRGRILTDDWDGTTLPDGGAWDAGFPQPLGDDADADSDAGLLGPDASVDATTGDDETTGTGEPDGDDGSSTTGDRDADVARDAGARDASAEGGSDPTGAAINPAAWPYAASPTDARTTTGCSCRVGGEGRGDASVPLAGSFGALLALGLAKRRRSRRAGTVGPSSS